MHMLKLYYTYETLSVVRKIIAVDEARWQRFGLRECENSIAATYGTGQDECRQQAKACPSSSSTSSFRHSLVSRALYKKEILCINRCDATQLLII